MLWIYVEIWPFFFFKYVNLYLGLLPNQKNSSSFSTVLRYWYCLLYARRRCFLLHYLYLTALAEDTLLIQILYPKSHSLWNMIHYYKLKNQQHEIRRNISTSELFKLLIQYMRLLLLPTGWRICNLHSVEELWLSSLLNKTIFWLVVWEKWRSPALPP